MGTLSWYLRRAALRSRAGPDGRPPDAPCVAPAGNLSTCSDLAGRMKGGAARSASDADPTLPPIASWLLDGAAGSGRRSAVPSMATAGQIDPRPGAQHLGGTGSDACPS